MIVSVLINLIPFGLLALVVILMELHYRVSVRKKKFLLASDNELDSKHKGIEK